MKKLLAVLIIFIALLAITGCGGPEEDEGLYINGTYTGSARGYNDLIEVEVVIEGGSITAVNVLSHDETPGLSDSGFDDTIAAIIANQSTEGVDAVSGATATSDGVISAVDEALAGAVR